MSDTSAPPLPALLVQESESEIVWVAVIRGATVHSGPSVSDPITGYYSVGTELHLIDFQQGWYQVVDPATERRGWVYAKYYLEEIRGPGQTIVTAREPSSPANPVVRVKRAARLGPEPADRTKPGTPPFRRHSESFASLVERAFRGY